MKRVSKILGMSLAFVLFAGVLTGCGKADPDPNSGLYEAVSATMMGMEIDVTDVYENGVSFDLQDGGKCIANMDGETAKIKWSTDGDSIHIEGGGVELDGTIGGGDMTLVNMMDMGMDMKFHCDELLHSDLADGDEGSSDDDSSEKPAASGGVLKRLKDAKEGKDVYGSASSSSDSDDDLWGDLDDEEGDSGSDEPEVIENDDDSDVSGLMTEDGAIEGDIFLNPDYENISGKEFTGEEINVSVPDGWAAFEASDGTVRVIKGGSSMDDYLSNASVVAEWHEDATGKLDTSNMEEPIGISHFKLGDHDYNGAYGTVPGDWTSYMFIDEYEDGYLLVTLSLPADSDVFLLDADVQAIMASVEV